MIPKENYIGFRTDLEDYFKWMTGVPPHRKSFTPFIYHTKRTVNTFWYWRRLFEFVEEGSVIMQVWPGHYKCDCFIFTLEDLEDYCNTNKIKIEV
jgi:hypothetical protein